MQFTTCVRASASGLVADLFLCSMFSERNYVTVAPAQPPLTSTHDFHIFHLFLSCCHISFSRPLNCQPVTERVQRECSQRQDLFKSPLPQSEAVVLLPRNANLAAITEKHALNKRHSIQLCFHSISPSFVIDKYSLPDFRTTRRLFPNQNSRYIWIIMCHPNCLFFFLARDIVI